MLYYRSPDFIKHVSMSALIVYKGAYMSRVRNLKDWAKYMDERSINMCENSQISL